MALLPEMPLGEHVVEEVKGYTEPVNIWRLG